MEVCMNNKYDSLHSRVAKQVEEMVLVLRDKKLTVGFAESCTGGLLSSLFTEQAGVSDVFIGSVISYDNKVKQSLLKVSEESLKTVGAVSKEVAQQMAEGALQTLNVSVAVAVTGIAGPNGGSVRKPVGTVFIAVAGAQSEVKVFEHHFDGDRKQIQLQSCGEAMKHMIEFLN